MDDKEYTLSYGSGICIAEKWSDRACIGDKLCVDDYTLWPYNLQKGMDFDGLMGLSPHSNTLFSKLVESGAIEKPVFGFALGQPGQPSSVRFGGIDRRFMKTDTISWVSTKTLTPVWWTLPFIGAKVNGKNAWSGNTNQGIIDSGTSNLVMEGSDFQVFAKELRATTEGLQSAQGGAILYYNGACPESGPEIEISLPGVDLYIPSDQYFQEFEKEGFCLVRVSDGGVGSMYIVGDVGMRNYYTVFDQGNMRVGFTPIQYPRGKTSQKPASVLDKIKKLF